jgi:hypothetical protein
MLEMVLLRRRGRRRKQSSSLLLSLPAEIYLEILRYLDTPSTYCLQLVCRRFYQLIPPIPSYQLTHDIKAAIKEQIRGQKLCRRCTQYRPFGAFPQLVGSTPDEALVPNGLEGWFRRVRQAMENKQRIGKQEALLRRYGLIYPVPWRIDPYRVEVELPAPGSWGDRSHAQSQLQWSRGAKYIQCRQPHGAWVRKSPNDSHLFEYRGFCGWVCQGPVLGSWRWIFRCECLRCLPVAKEGYNTCCWCDPADSRYHVLTPLAWESHLAHTEDPGRILFRTKVRPYGKETSWVGRRRNTYGRYLDQGLWV